jgi:hypothetical protein
LEYSNEQNKIHLIYPEYNNDTGTSTLNIGELNADTGEISNLSNISEVTGLQLFNRTFDQNTETLVFIAIDLDNQQRLYMYNTITNQLNSQPLPQTELIEIEADNFGFAQARFGQLGISENYINPITIYPNPTKDSFKINFDGIVTEYELFDLLGKSVQKGSIQNGRETDVSNLNKGIYILDLKSNFFNLKKRLVVQ